MKTVQENPQLLITIVENRKLPFKERVKALADLFELKEAHIPYVPFILEGEKGNTPKAQETRKIMPALKTNKHFFPLGVITAPKFNEKDPTTSTDYIVSEFFANFKVSHQSVAQSLEKAPLLSFMVAFSDIYKDLTQDSVPVPE